MSTKPDPRLKLLGLRIRGVRNERDLTQEDLADLASINRNHIGAIERGDKIAGLTVFLKIADALEIKPSELMSACDPR